ncbi:MAG: large subunit ribosomal protein [Humisphaera sp.]|nr:large subunit ribosomal protein [Humisphaera sp.]
MAYKFKPNKSVKKRFRVTAKGKLKRGHSLTSHLRSARTAKKKRELRRPEILFEGHAKNMRKLMGISGNHPSTHRNKPRHAAPAKTAATAKA